MSSSKQSVRVRENSDQGTRRDFLKQASLLVAGSSSALWLPNCFRIASAQEAAAGPVVETNAGKLRGNTNSGVHAFLGVPYGAPTTGRRFKRAAKPQAWTGVRDALAYGPSAPAGGADPAGGGTAQSDDCLVLNVWSSSLSDSAKRPVMFWLHGGGFTSGSGSSPLYNGANLARRGDVVVVTINHRLGFLGYAHFGDLIGPEYAESGNVGMLDCVLALEWVRDNIARFGGDPNCVMIFGESGGGSKSSMLTAMPEAKGLFHRAAMQSGAGLRAVSTDDATRSAELFLRQLELTKANFEEVQKLPLARVKAAAAAARGANWSPVVDGKVLPRHPWDPDGSPVSADIPILAGSNRTEQTFFERANLDEIYAMDEAKLRARLTTPRVVGPVGAPQGLALGDDADRVLKLYQTYFPKASPGELYLYIVTDSGFWFRNATLAERKAAQKKAPVFVYVFDWEVDPRMKSPHAGEIAFVFDNVTNPSEGAKALAKKMSTAWVTFAKTGNPNTSDLQWTPYSLENRETMMLGANCHIERDPWKEARSIFAERAKRAT